MNQQLLATANKLCELGLNRGTSGNCSVRIQGKPLFLITPSGIPVDRMSANNMVVMDFDGRVVSDGETSSRVTPDRKPSSEWRFHRDILLHRPQVNAVIHTHSLFATALSCQRRDLPAFHYMIAVAGGDSIRCAPYALFGSQTLSDFALQALEDRKACLLANHGMIATGKDLDSALTLALEVETLCQQYLEALKTGEPVLLTEEEMQQVITKFKSYGPHSNGPVNEHGT